jgi:hypothetical protein
MKVGDLVRHKRTGAVGLVARLPKDNEYYFAVKWLGTNGVDPEQIFGALVVISASR